MTLPVAILAGGRATRLGARTRSIPKSLVQVAGRPFVEHQLLRLRHQGYCNVVLCVGHLGDQVVDAVGDGGRWGMTIRYSFDGPALLGTGGALRRSLELLGCAFLVQYGDSYLTCDFQELERAFLHSAHLGLMAVVRNNSPRDRSNVVYRNGVIANYDKGAQQPDMHHVDYGLLALQAAAFEQAPDGEFDLSVVLVNLIKRRQLGGWEVSERFYEIGSPAGLRETRRLLATNHPAA